METKNRLDEIELRLAALEKAVASLAEKKGEHSDEPSGQFAHLGGIERLPAGSFEASDDLEARRIHEGLLSLGGKLVLAPRPLEKKD